MTTKSTSFRLSTHTLSLLKQLAESENRSLTNMVETLIQNESIKLLRELPAARELHAYLPMSNGICSICGWRNGEYCHSEDKVKEKGIVK